MSSYTSSQFSLSDSYMVRTASLLVSSFISVINLAAVTLTKIIKETIELTLFLLLTAESASLFV